MTALGKILVGVNLIFSALTCGLIVMVYAARTNWNAAYLKAENNVKVAQANAQTYLAEVEEVKKTANADLKKVQAEVVQARTERDNWEKQAKSLQTMLDAEKTAKKSADVNVASVTEELNRRRDEIEKLKGFVTERDQKMLDLERDKKDFRDRAVAAELNFKSEQERNTNLLAQVENLSRTTGAQAGTGAAGPGTSVQNPPPEDVEGIVLQSDAATGYVTISIGSDAGITRGNTLEVYRLKPEPKYLGTIQVLEVRADRAVGKPVGAQRRGPILVGDRVASTILSKR